MGNSASAPKLTPDEMLKISQRNINKSVRAIERDKNKVYMEEQKAIKEIRKLADKGQKESAQAMAKSIIRMRKHQNQLMKMKSTAQGLSLRLMTMRTTAQMSTSMKEFTRIMSRMSAQMDSKEIQAVMKEFAVESEKQQMSQDMMDDAIDDAMGDDEVESEELVNSVFDELQIDIDGQMSGIPNSKLPNGANKNAQPAAAQAASDSALEARLAALRS